MADGQLSRSLPPHFYADPRHARWARLRLAVGNPNEGNRADGLDDRAPVRDRLRETRAQQAAFEADDRPFCKTEAQRAAVEFVLGYGTRHCEPPGRRKAPPRWLLGRNWGLGKTPATTKLSS